MKSGCTLLKRGLSSYLPSENLHFLGRPEQSLYDALISHDRDFFRNLAREVRDVVDLVRPSKVYCDAMSSTIPDTTWPCLSFAQHSRHMGTSRCLRCR